MSENDLPLLHFLLRLGFSDFSFCPLLFENSGEPGRTRTCNPLIKSQLLYH
jgi:hypothetical protein